MFHSSHSLKPHPLSEPVFSLSHLCVFLYLLFFIIFPLKQWLCVSRGTAAVLHLSMACIVFPVSRFMHLAFARLALPKKIPKVCTVILMNSRTFHLICALTLIIASGIQE